MRLKELIEPLGCAVAAENLASEVKGITSDSRKVGPGVVFVAIKGLKHDGNAFIKDALSRGAPCAVSEEKADADIAVVEVKDARDALARISARFYGEPSRELTLAGVTGTNGKTTTSYLLESIFRAAGHRSGLIGTINYRYGDVSVPSSFTTPEAPDIQRMLREMVSAGVTHCVMEASSHSIEQKRIEYCKFSVKAFTNLTRDHLDYHATMENYFTAKKRLFTEFPGESVVNIDDPWGEKLAAMLKNRITYSAKRPADIGAVDCSLGRDGIDAALSTPLGRITVASALPCEHNLYNIMAAVGMAATLGVKASAVEEGVNSLKSVPGRLEPLTNGSITAYIDFAHSPDALERVIVFLKNHAAHTGRLITVFGCPGEADRGKRPVMGEMAARLSDITIITTDNPRGEDPVEIIKEIETGMKGARKYAHDENPRDKGYFAIPDRGEAILKAVEISMPGDAILVAGKGHEDCQIIGAERVPFKDRTVLECALRTVAPFLK